MVLDPERYIYILGHLLVSIRANIMVLRNDHLCHTIDYVSIASRLTLCPQLFYHYNISFLFVKFMIVFYHVRLTSDITQVLFVFYALCNIWTVSSVGRASALHAEGRRFKPCTVHQISKLGDLISK